MLVVVAEEEIQLQAHLTKVQMEAQVVVDKVVHIKHLVGLFQQQEQSTQVVAEVVVRIIAQLTQIHKDQPVVLV
tara:strand:- start:76 stop:297 length:222 start_codon:yes stop_codon:yes gene_type:complete